MRAIENEVAPVWGYAASELEDMLLRAEPVALKKMNAGTLTLSDLQSSARAGLQEWARPWSTTELYFSYL